MPKVSITIFSQEELLLALRENKREILVALYQEVYPKVQGYILQNSGDIDQAKDIFQEAFLVVWQQVNTGEFVPRNTTALQGFLFQIAKNKWLDWLRSNKFRKEVYFENATPNIEETDDEDQYELRLGILENALQDLGETCRELLKSFYFQKVSIQDLAEKFGWTSQTAKNNKYRCMETLRKIIKK